MSKEHEYDFSELESDELEEKEIRPNYRIVKCCGNCKYYYYRANKQRRGHCKLPNPELKAIHTQGGQSYDPEEIDTKWTHTHSTTLCDNHRYKSKYSRIGVVVAWTKRIFSFDGIAED
jgi:hypothetical protein